MSVNGRALRKAVVVGAGQVGIAVSLALSHGQWHTTLVTRDKTSADVARSDGHLKAFAPVQRIPIPQRLQIVPGSDADALQECVQAAELVCVCVPSVAVSEVAPIVAKLGGSGPAAVVVFSRGLTTKGATPSELLDEATRGKAGVEVVTATGPFFAKEWANGIDATGSSKVVCPLSLCLSRKPKLWTDETLFSSYEGPACLTTHDTQLGSLSPSDAAVVERRIGLVNALAAIASVGAGIVTNQYPGNVSAQASYHLHCLLATNHLLEQLTGPLTPAVNASAMSSVVAATLTSACYNLAAREFAYGRSLDFNFRRQDAVKAHFGNGGGSSHQQSLDATCDGIFALLEEKQVQSPFYSTLCDAYLCVLRGSTAGKYLVRPMDYGWLEELRKPPEVLKHMSVLDEAVAADDAKGFETAKKRLADAMNATEQ